MESIVVSKNKSIFESLLACDHWFWDSQDDSVRFHQTQSQLRLWAVNFNPNRIRSFIYFVSALINHDFKSHPLLVLLLVPQFWRWDVCPSRKFCLCVSRSCFDCILGDHFGWRNSEELHDSRGESRNFGTRSLWFCMGAQAGWKVLWNAFID